MSIKVAIASSDGKYINQHFGKTNKFLIFQVNGPDDYDFVELREDEPSCGSYREDGQSQTKERADLLSDCKAVIVSQIGPGASQKLIDKGIIPFEESCFITDALDHLSNVMDQLDDILKK
ncbi:MAG: dinitrogenase iron-molybdenum cofactor biosynthesis protein [Methanobacteriales archaeon HGW-Methanobacteriales-1]|jgi:predicted Fe-Mo cluster-binding NifX family protein|nr:MAG: dinitrogenase iron-molybdenum cofactor biosynthesis protein [Methanobacteriales archaeon HGW-Methanobacteriales-1]